MEKTTSRRRRALTTLAILLSVALPQKGAGQGKAGVFEFRSLNRAYDHLASDLAPFTSGPLLVRLDSPQHVLTLHSHRIVLRPLARSTYDLALQLEFSGSGHLVADLEVSAARSRLEDDLVVPQQRRTVLAKVQIARSPSGYLLTPEATPQSFEIEIESRLAQRLMGACKSLAVFGLLPLGCDSLKEGLTRVEVPLPAPGETYLLEEGRLTAAEREELDRFLRETGAIFLAPQEE